MNEPTYIALSNLVFGYHKWAKKQPPQQIDGDPNDCPGNYFETEEAKKELSVILSQSEQTPDAAGSAEEVLRILNKLSKSVAAADPTGYDVLIKDLKKQSENLASSFQSYASAKDKEIAELRAWKESMLSVTPDMQAIGKALNVPLGQSIHDKILPGIEALRDEVERLRGLVKNSQTDLIWNMIEENQHSDNTTFTKQDIEVYLSDWLKKLTLTPNNNSTIKTE